MIIRTGDITIEPYAPASKACYQRQGHAYKEREAVLMMIDISELVAIGAQRRARICGKFAGGNRQSWWSWCGNKAYDAKQQHPECI